jgi:hypothetical protein
MCSKEGPPEHRCTAIPRRPCEAYVVFAFASLGARRAPSAVASSTWQPRGQSPSTWISPLYRPRKHPQGGRFGHQFSQEAPDYPFGRDQVPVGNSKNKFAGVFSIIINIGDHIKINISIIFNMNGYVQININILIIIVVIIIIIHIEWSV